MEQKLEEQEIWFFEL